ncbi:MAG: serine hydrolase, partial [Bacteroidota bacterium]
KIYLNSNKTTRIMHAKTLLFTLSLSLLLSSCTVGRFFLWNFANIDDYEKFQNRPVDNDEASIHQFAIADLDTFALPSLRKKKKKYKWEEGLDKTRTVAFLVMRNDTILYEYYTNGYEQYTPVNSFSMAKSYISTLIGIAKDEDLIKDLDAPVTDYLPNLPSDLKKVTLRNLLEMRTGLDYNESYASPFSDAAVYYYGRKLEKQYQKLKLASEPDSYFQYRSVNTQLLAEVVEEVYQKPLNEILQEKIWKPLGSEQAASWSVDNKKDQTFKAFCCLNAVARDFARLGLLFMNEGSWYGDQIVSKEWVKEATTFSEPRNYFRYTYQWWQHPVYRNYSDTLDLPSVYERFESTNKAGETIERVRYPGDSYSARGHLGQYIYVNPTERIVIVRLGKNYGKPSPGWRNYMDWIARENGVNRSY